ncbi:hypothetical protein HT136_23135 [Novosphingobium profundi]|uniref:hypothetical protein n=1 Tax=Novosphingobium profundi TaxID=1774954 RepID=UPI001BD9858F|nr:hypothetical protein [Novosphingobium profundi]MBT0671269.1 hypothetical protein [Novosphingobium profundi]
MKNRVIAIALAASGAALAPLAAQAQAPEVVHKDARGHAEQVRVGGKVYDVCRGEMRDGCINPRAAGLNWGNRPLDHWPGQPASTLHEH